MMCILDWQGHLANVDKNLSEDQCEAIIFAQLILSLLCVTPRQ